MARIKNWEKKWDAHGPRSETLWRNTETDRFIRLIQAERGRWLIEWSEEPGFDNKTRIYESDIGSKRLAKQKASHYMREYPQAEKPEKYWHLN